MDDTIHENESGDVLLFEIFSRATDESTFQNFEGPAAIRNVPRVVKEFK